MPADPASPAAPASARPAGAPPAGTVDPRGPRFGAGITAVLLLVVLFLALTDAVLAAAVLLAAITALFAWGAFAGIGRHPYGALFKRLVRPRLGPPSEFEDVRPPTFAQGVGFAISLIGTVFGLLGVGPVLVAAAVLAFLAAFLNSVFGICIGCRLYVLLVRARVIRPRAAAAA